MRRFRVGLFVVLCAAHACTRSPAPPVSTPQPDAVTTAPTPAPSPTSTLWPLPAFDGRIEVTTASVQSSYRLTLDRRFVQAFSLISEILNGGEPSAVDIRFDGGGWQVELAGSKVAGLPEYASFDDVLVPLTAVATAAKVKLPAGRARNSERAIWLEGPFDELSAIDGEWNAGTRTLALVRAAARDLSLASLQMEDSLAVGDAVPARALALLAILRSHGDPAWLETALLADAMGYRTDAMKAAAKLGAAEPVKWYVLRDDAKLEALSKKKDAAATYLWLRRLSTHRTTGLLDEQLTACCSLKPTIPTLALQTSQGHSSRQRALQYLQFVSFQEAAVAADKDPETEFRAAAPDKILSSFSALVTAPPEAPGSLVGPEPHRAYLRAAFHTATYGTLLYFVDTLAAPAGATRFLASLGVSTVYPETELSRALAVIASKKMTRDEMHAAVSTTLVRGDAVPRFHRALLASEPDDWASSLSGLKAMAAHLDSRPEQRERLYRWLEANSVLPVLEPLAASLDAQAPGMSLASRWLALRTRNVAAMERLATAPGTSAYARVFTLLSMLEHGMGDPAALRSRIDKIVAAEPDDWSTTEIFVDHLLEDREYKLARKTLDRALTTFTKKSVVRNGKTVPLGDTGLSEFSVRTKIGELALTEGRCEDGWRVVEPGLRSEHGGVLSSGAFLQACMGKTEEALALVERHRKRYPGAFAESVAIRTFWLLGDHAGAAKHADANLALLSREWTRMGSMFFRDHRRQKPSERLAAFDKLAEAGLPWDAVTAFAAHEFEKGDPETAFEYITVRTMKAGPRMIQASNAYRYLRAAKGEAAAIAWVRDAMKTLPPDYPRSQIEIFLFMEGIPELIVPITGELPSEEADDVRWSLRAVAAVQNGPPYPDLLLRHFQEGELTAENGAHRVLLGVGAPLDQVIELTRKEPNADAELATLAFQLGVRAEADGRRDDAAVWYCLSIEYTPFGRGLATRPLSSDKLNLWKQEVPPPAKTKSR